jgi:threonine/homoserine/homoserine lactone efflux protein
MFGIHDFGLFLAAGVLLNLTPGPDTAYILGRTVAQGRDAGIASALGICAAVSSTPALQLWGYPQYFSVRQPHSV